MHLAIGFSHSRRYFASIDFLFSEIMQVESHPFAQNLPILATYSSGEVECHLIAQDLYNTYVLCSEASFPIGSMCG